MRLFYLIVPLLLVLTACEPDTPRVVEVPVEEHVEIEPVVALLPGRTTLLAVDPAGSIYWMQREAGQPDVLFISGRDGVPRATGLSSETILQALGVTENGEGSIQSFVAIDEGQVWFYFQGGTRRQTLAAVGRYMVDTSKVEIIADTPKIQSLTRMGASLDLASGTLVRSGQWLWLWVRHTDIAVLARFEPGNAEDAQFSVDQAFTHLRTNEGPLALTLSELELAEGPGDSLVLLDRRWGSIWQVDANGRAEPVERLTGLPRAVSMPTYDTRGRTLLFASESETFPPRPAEPYRPPVVMTSYPALLIVSQDQTQAFGRDNIRGQVGVVTYRLRLQQLVAEPDGRSWLGYDEASGQIVRVRVR